MNTENKIGLQIKILGNEIRRATDARVGQEWPEVSTVSACVLMYIKKKTDLGTDVFQKDIERHFSISRATASKIVTGMEKKGLIKRESVAFDARLRKLSLTDKAEKMTSFFMNDSDVFDENIIAGFSEEEKQQLICYLIRMRNNINGAEINGKYEPCINVSETTGKDSR